MAISAQRRRRALVAVVAALIAAGAFYLAMEYSGKAASNTPAGNTTGPSATAVPTMTVVEASVAIPQGSQISTTDLKTATVPISSLPTVPSGQTAPYYTSLTALTTTKEYAAIAVPAGTVVLSSMVTTSAAAAAPPVAGSGFTLPSGYVAMSLPYNPAAGKGEEEGEGTGGYLTAGDRIDILVEVDPQPNPNNVLGNMYWAYENVLVIAVGTPSGAPMATPSASSSATPSASSSASTANGASASLIMVELPKQDAANMSYLEDGPNVTIQYLIVAPPDYPPSGSPAPTGNTAPAQINSSSALTQLEG